MGMFFHLSTASKISRCFRVVSRSKISRSKISRSKISLPDSYDSFTRNKKRIPLPAWTVISSRRNKRYLLLDVQYSNANHFEGHKLLLFRTRLSVKKITELSWLDPHFMEDSKTLTLIARFRPDSAGKRLALSTLKQLGRAEVL